MLVNNSTFQGFLATLALSKFEHDIKAQEEKVFALESAVRYEKYKQDFMSTLMVLLEYADLDRRELNFVLSDIEEATPDEIKSKIQWVSNRLGEHPDPKKQFELRSKLL